jgi:hypothetical protein
VVVIGPEAPLRPARTLSPTDARALLLVNLVVLPGIGSFLAGRRLVGVTQATLALAGLAAVAVWLSVVVGKWLELDTLDEFETIVLWAGLTGAGMMLTAWFWGLSTGLSVLRAVRRCARSTPSVA